MNDKEKLAIEIKEKIELVKNEIEKKKVILEELKEQLNRLDKE